MEKDFSFGNLGKLQLYVDAFNIFGRSGVNINDDPAAELNYFSTPRTYTLSTTYGLVTSVYGVRSIRFGATYSF